MPINKRFVSIVDDEIDITVLFEDAICADITDISVVSFNDPTIAFEHFSKNKEAYALVISDMRMPDMDGLALLNKVKEHNPGVRTMLVSAYDFQNNPIFEKYLKQGIIDSFMEKPIKINKLCQKVRDEIQAYRQGVKEI
ncbi:MAG: response regulator [Thermoproteota archaeon]|nr:response regulator [Thermoproteota archaeon]